MCYKLWTKIQIPTPGRIEAKAALCKRECFIHPNIRQKISIGICFVMANISCTAFGAQPQLRNLYVKYIKHKQKDTWGLSVYVTSVLLYNQVLLIYQYIHHTLCSRLKCLFILFLDWWKRTCQSALQLIPHVRKSMSALHQS